MKKKKNKIQNLQNRVLLNRLKKKQNKIIRFQKIKKTKKFHKTIQILNKKIKELLENTEKANKLIED